MKSTLTAIGLLAVAGMAAAAIMSEGAAQPNLDSLSTHTIQRGTLLVTVTEQGTLESSNNTEIKCRVRGDNTIISVIESGTHVEAGKELLRLETLGIEEEISERTKFYHLANSAVARSRADVEKAKIAIKEYLQGRYVSSLATMQKNLAVAEAKLLSAKDRLSHAKMMAKSEYASELEVEEKEFAVAQADLDMKLTETRINVLKQFTKKDELATLNGELNAAKALHEADVERAYADEERLKRAQEELTYCIIEAPRSGMVIYPTGKAWEDAPDIEEGATVHKDQVLLLMPDLTSMQVKVGMHESIIDRIQKGLSAKVSLPGRTFNGEISYVTPVAKPAGWWSGNVVKYDTIVTLPTTEGLKPGMSVEVEVVLARHTDVLLIPTAAVIETAKGRACWVRNGNSIERRALELGDRDDMLIVVENGLKEGDQVILDPLANIEEAQIEAAKTLNETQPQQIDMSDI